MKQKVGMKNEIKITQKISTKDFVNLIKKNPRKIVISESILNQSKNMRLMVELINKIYSSSTPPRIEILGRKKIPRIIEQDWMDPYIRSLIGEAPPLGLSLEMGLLRLNAITPKNAVSLFEMEPNKIKELPKLIEAEHLVVTKNFKIYLTELGIMIAKGAIKIYG